MMQKKHTPIKLFVVVFVALAALVAIQNLMQEKIIALSVPDNAGVSVLETVGNSLVSVFQDGQVVVWDWDVLPQTKGDFRIVSDQAVILDAEHMAAVNTGGKKWLTIYTLPEGKKKKEMSVGWADQDVWLRISPDKKTVALVRRNVPDSKGGILYEFLTLNVEKERTGSPISVSIQQDSEDFIDFVVSDVGVLYAVGSQKDTGRIAAVDIEKGSILWGTVYENTKEFCSCMTASGGAAIYAGNRDGVLYKIDATTGEVIKKIKLLEPGETRPVTNDYSVLNLAFSPNGKNCVATINPKAYILKAETDEIFHSFSPADRLVSKITFSPDNQFLATSDIRAGYPIKIWPMPEEE